MEVQEVSAPDIQRLRTSERRSFKTCPQQWWWQYREGLVPKVQRVDARWFGTGIHMALAERYKFQGMRRGRDVLKVWREYCGENRAVIRAIGTIDTMDETEWLDAKELGEAMLGSYLDRYGKDERWSVISTEQTFEVPILYPKSMMSVADRVEGKPRQMRRYNGTFDGVRRDLTDDEVWLWECKTAAQIALGHLWGDDQAGSYWLVAPDVLKAHGINLPGGTIAGIQYDFLRKAMPDERPTDHLGRARNKPTKEHYRAAFAKAGYTPLALATKLEDYEALAAKRKIEVFGDVSARQPTPNFHREPVYRNRGERRTQMNRIQNEALWQDAIENGTLPLIKNPMLQNCRGCYFQDMCELHEQGSDWEEYRSLAFTSQDPYADHRKSAHDEGA